MVIRVPSIIHTSLLGIAFSDTNNILTIGLQEVEHVSKKPRQGVLQEYAPFPNIRPCTYYIVVSKLPKSINTEISYYRGGMIEDLLKSSDHKYREIPKNK